MKPARSPGSSPFEWRGYLIAIIAIGAGAGLRLLLRHFSLWDAPLVTFATAVLLVAVYRGLGPALTAAFFGGFLWTQFPTNPVRMNFPALFMGGIAISVPASLLFAERRKTRAREQKSREQEKLIELAHDAILVLDPDNVILKWNAGATTIYGWTEAEALGKVTDTLFETKTSGPPREVSASLSSDGFWEGELRHLAHNGSQITVESRKVLLRDETGAPFRILEINREITKRRDAESAMRRSESRFRRLCAANLIGVGWGDPAGSIVEANSAFLRMTGNSSDDLRSGAIPYREFSSVTCGPLEKELVRKDGSRIAALQVAAAPETPGEEGVVLMMDLSERKALEQKLRHKQKRETIGQLAAGVAHDFNNALTIILMNAQLAYDAIPATHPARRLLESVTNETERAGTLTKQLLAYAGKGVQTLASTDLAALLREAVAQMPDTISPRIPMKLDLDPELPAIEADEDQIRQLVMNILVNASEAIGDRADGEIGVSAIRSEAGSRDSRWISSFTEARTGASALIRVRDNGCGMDETTVAKAFDPFFTTKLHGRGLGLSAAQGIAHAHHGAIRIVSSPGQGATLEVLLPAAPRSKPAQ